VTRPAAILLALALAAHCPAEEVIWKPAPVEPAAKFGPPQRVAVDVAEMTPRPRSLPRALAEPVAPRLPVPEVVRTQFATERYAQSLPRPTVSCEAPPAPPSKPAGRYRFIWDALNPAKTITPSQFVPRPITAPSATTEPAARLAVPKS